MHFLSTICLQLCITSNSIVFYTSELPIIKSLFNSPVSPESPTTSQSFQFSSHPVFTPFPTNKQTNKQHKFHLHLMRFSLASLHHLQNSLFILHLTLSLFIPHSHSCSSSCTPPPNPAASSACLPAASPPADRTPPPSPTFHPLSLSYLPHDHQLLEAGHQQRRVHLHQRRVLRHLRSLLRFLAQTLVHSRQNLLQFLRGRSLQ